MEIKGQVSMDSVELVQFCASPKIADKFRYH